MIDGDVEYLAGDTERGKGAVVARLVFRVQRQRREQQARDEAGVLPA